MRLNAVVDFRQSWRLLKPIVFQFGNGAGARSVDVKRHADDWRRCLLSRDVWSTAATGSQLRDESSGSLPGTVDAAGTAGTKGKFPAEGFDWRELDRWTATLLADDVSPIVSVFRRHGAQGPSMEWDPSPERDAPGPIRFLLTYWTALAAGRTMPGMQEIDALALRPALGYIALLDVVDGGRDFRYRLYGTILSAVAGFDMSGRLASEHKASAHITLFYMASYRAAVTRCRPFFTEHRPGSTQITKGWHRLVLPFAGADGSVQRFLVGGVPIGHDGRMIRITL
jgi:PAS domain-containing protein